MIQEGLLKEIIFHCFWRTYATLQLSRGTDIHMVSKMLGHREQKTMQISANIINQTNWGATNKIALDL